MSAGTTLAGAAARAVDLCQRRACGRSLPQTSDRRGNWPLLFEFGDASPHIVEGAQQRVGQRLEGFAVADAGGVIGLGGLRRQLACADIGRHAAQLMGVAMYFLDGAVRDRVR